MIRIRDLSLPPDGDMARLVQAAARQLRISPNEIKQLDLKKKSVDARKKNDVRIIYTVDNGELLICIVDAVPINEQAPQLGQALHFAQSSFSSSISPRSNFALYIPSCSRVSISGPAFIVPPGTNTDGILTLASPIRFPGTPLSQLER